MKRTLKILIIALSILLVYIASRFIFSYTIVNQPLMFGTNTYVGDTKYDFPICILNTRKIEGMKKHIARHWEDVAKKADSTKREKIYCFFASDFDIISVAVSKECMDTDKTVDSFLLQQKESPENNCVVVIDKKTKQLLRIRF